MSLRKSLGYFTGREYHEGLFSSPTQNANASATATGNATNAELNNEENYVNSSEANLRGAIAGLGPNPYFTSTKPPAPVNPSATANFSSAAPQNGGASANLFAAPQSTNMFAAPAQQRQAQPAMRAPAPAAQ
jgi:hypothetical protein